MKNLLLLLVILLFVIASHPMYAAAQAQPLPSPLFCVGNNPSSSCATIAPTQNTTSITPPQASTAPSTSVSNSPSNGVSSAPSTAQTNPSPSTNPCKTSQSSVTEQNAGNSSVQAFKVKKRAPTGNGLLQQLLQLILQLLQLLLQQIGGNLPGGGGSGGGTTPCPSPSSTQPTSGQPSSAPSPSIGVVATPTIFGTTPVPSQGASPSAAPSKPPGATAGKTGLLESGVAAGTSTTNKLCLDDKGNGSADNTVVQTYACNSADKAQQWTPYSDNTIRINGKCLDVNKNGTANNTKVDLFTCNGGKNQQWTLTKISTGANNGKTELLGVQSNKCLDISKSSTANGTQLEIFQCNNGNNQVWAWNTGTLPPTTGGSGATIKTSGLLQSGMTAAKLCLDSVGASAANKNVAQTFACNSADKAQKWAEYSDGTIRFMGASTTSTACLDVVGQGTKAGTKVDIYACNGGANQVWTMTNITTGAAKGKMELKSKQSGLCLDISGSSTKSPGPQLEIFTCNNGNNQAWSWNTGTITPPTNGGGGGGTTATQTHSGMIKSAMTAAKLCLDSIGASSANNTIVQTYTCNTADKAQQWKAYSDGTIKFTSPTGTKATACLEVLGQSTANGAEVDLFQCNGGANQVWTMNSQSELVSKQSGKCLDIHQSSTAIRTPLEIFQCNAGNNQKWSWQ